MFIGSVVYGDVDHVSIDARPIWPYVDEAMQEIDQKAFLSRALDPLHYYNFLPSDQLRITGDVPSQTALELARQLLGREPDDALNSHLDALSIKLINEFDTLPKDEVWHQLADQMAHWYAQTLRPSGSKTVRMRSQLVNFFLRDVLEFNANDDTEVEVSTLPALCPWDFLRLDDRDIWLTSDNENVVQHYHNGLIKRSRCGLPTRMDLLPDGRVSIHSLYSPGSWLLEGSEETHLEHDTPIILVFNYKERYYFIDFRGYIYDMETRKRKTELLLEQIHFARLCEGRVFLIDCCRVGKIFELILEDFSLCEHDISPIIICNDLCWIEDKFYLIDKEQGSVFAFTEHFEYKEKKLHFGRGRGRLWDPAAIRSVGDEIQVLNWFTNTIISFKPF